MFSKITLLVVLIFLYALYKRSRNRYIYSFRVREVSENGFCITDENANLIEICCAGSTPSGIDEGEKMRIE